MTILINGRPLLIAVDGVAASGKGTLAKRIAAFYGLAYLDTGILYRAVGRSLIDAGLDPHDVTAATQAAGRLDFSRVDRARLYCEGAGAAASVVAAMPEVRAVLLDFQRKAAKSKDGAILDGRDVGTVVCPDAHVKFFITATPEARAMRRFKQLQSMGQDIIYDDVARDLARRDARDRGRAASPLVAAADAVSFDTTALNVEEVLAKAMTAIEKRIEVLSAVET
ncbi:MAG: (d)CMP kinase [Rickettsiales bacterium]